MVDWSIQHHFCCGGVPCGFFVGQDVWVFRVIQPTSVAVTFPAGLFGQDFWVFKAFGALLLRWRSLRGFLGHILFF